MVFFKLQENKTILPYA